MPSPYINVTTPHLGHTIFSTKIKGKNIRVLNQTSLLALYLHCPLKERTERTWMNESSTSSLKVIVKTLQQLKPKMLAKREKMGLVHFLSYV